MNRMNTFENKVQTVFLKNSRWPLFLIFILSLTLMIGYYLYQEVYVIYKLQNEIVTKIESTIKIMDANLDNLTEHEIVDTKLIFEKYYAINSELSVQTKLIIYQEDKIVFISQPSLEGNIYNHTYNNYILNTTRLNTQYFTSMNVSEEKESTNLVYGHHIAKNGMEYTYLVYILDVYFNDIFQEKRMHHLVLTDSYNNIIATTSQDFISTGKKFMSNDQYLNLEHISYKVHSNQFLDANLKLHILTTQDVILPILMLLVLVTLFFIFIITRLNRRLSKNMGREVSQSVNKMMAAVEEINKGNLDFRVDISSGDEFDNLADSFNHMSDELGRLITSNNKLVELRKNAEINQLIAQFNPHFLYNSLETIRYLVDQDSQKAKRLILNISKLLRYSIETEEIEVVFKDDLQYIIIYLEIQKIRLGNRFSYDIDIEEEVLLTYVPKLLLQPLVENSIKHGFLKKKELHIEIKGYIIEDKIHIIVADNGSGIREDILQKLISNEDQEDGTPRYGLNSVRQRIELMYGISGPMHITSNQMRTSILVILPRGDNNV